MADEPRDQTHRLDAAIDRYWDAIADGRLAASDPDLDPRLARTIRRVHALAGDPQPEPDRIDALWRDLMSGYAPSAPLQLAPSFPAPTNGRDHALRPIARPARQIHRRLHTALSVIATIALIAAVIGMIVMFYNQNNQATPPPGPASPTAVSTQIGSWLTYAGNPARTRNVPGPALAGDPVLLWTADVGVYTTASAGAVAEGVVYWSGNGGLAAIDAQTGQHLWFTSEASGNPEIDGDGLIVPSAAATGAGYDLMRIKRSDGSLVWRIEAGLIPDGGVVAIVDGVGYTQSGQELIAFDPASGEVSWRAPHPTSGLAWMAVTNDVIATGGQTSDLTLYSASGGDLLWTYHTEEGAVGPPTMANGMVYFRTMDLGELAFYAVDVATGELRWRIPSPSGRFSNPAVSETTVYALSGDGALYAFDAMTGEVRWTYQIGPSEFPAPALAGDTVLVSGPGNVLIAVDATNGAERWRFELDSPPDSNPVVASGVVYVHMARGTLYAIGGAESAAAVDVTPQITGSPSGTDAGSIDPAPMPTPDSSLARFTWETNGSDLGRFQNPMMVRLSPDGKLWVSDTSDRYFIFDLDGNLLEIWGESGSGPGQFSFLQTDWANDIVWAADGSFFVADTYNQRVQHFDADRTPIGMFGANGTGDGQFLSPSGLAIAADGTLFVSDWQRNDVQHFTVDGTFLGRFDGSGTPGGLIGKPFSLAIDGDGNLWVAEASAGRVRTFSPDGREIGALNPPSAAPRSGKLNYPADIAIDASGYIYVADEWDNEIEVYDRDGRFVYAWGRSGSGAGAFNAPVSVAVNRGGAVYVSEYPSARVKKFTITGPFPAPASEATPAT